MSRPRRSDTPVPFRAVPRGGERPSTSGPDAASDGPPQRAGRRTLGFLGGLALVLGAIVVFAALTPAAANEKYAALVVDAQTGRTLFARHADAIRHPASLTKIMTIYIILEEIEAGRLTLGSSFTVSARAAARPPSKIGFKPGATITVENAIKALVTKSANDVASTVAENIGGSEAAFARRMTRTARRLGMNRTVFKNASGLPDDQQVTTARDMALLGMAIQRDFPQHYHYFGTRSFRYRGATYGNHNRLLGKIEGVDGIKTGFIRASGFNLVTSVRRDGRHIVAVVMGGRTGASRNAHMADLISAHLPKAIRRPGSEMAIASLAGAGANVPIPEAKPYGRVMAAFIEAQLAASEDFNTVEEDPEAFIDAFAVARNGTVPAEDGRGAIEVIEVASAPAEPGAGASAADSRIVKTIAIRPNRPAATATAPAVEGRDAIAAHLAFADAGADGGHLEEGSGDPLLDLISAYRESITGEPAPASDTVALVATTPSATAADLPPGWQIQIAATDSEATALILLTAARQKFPALLGDRPHAAVPIEADGIRLYRARFAGFPSQREAAAACRELTRAKQPCWVEAL